MQSHVMEWITIAKSSLEPHSREALLFVVLAAILSALILSKAIFGRSKQWPPGPPALPILGHLHLLGELPHRSLYKLSQTYGPLMGLRLGGVPTIVASSPEMAKELLHTHDFAFANRPRLAAAVYTCFNCTDVAYSPYGPYWKFLRQLYATELFSAKRLASFRHVREDEVRQLLRSLLQSAQQELGKAVELRPRLVATTNNINGRMVMGKKITEMTSHDSKPHLVDLIEEILHLLGVFYVGDYISWLAWFDPKGYLKRMKKVGEKITVALQDIIENRRESELQERQASQKNEARPQDLLDILIAAAENKDFDIEFTNNNIMATILDIFVGGTETSAAAVEWALADLMNNPKAMKKLQEELDDVVGRARLVGESDIANLPYLGSIVKESMRLHPIAPLLIPRESTQECHVGGYTIPPKTRAYVNTFAIEMSSCIWDKPLEFWPERFDKKHVDLRGQHFELLPFGSGRRKCPGWPLAFISVHLMLASLVQGFTWDFPRSSNAFDMSEKFGLTIAMAKPLCANCTPRLPMHLY